MSKSIYTAQAITKEKLFLSCSECNYEEAYDITHIVLDIQNGGWRDTFGTWYCPVCGFGISGRVHPNRTVTVTKERKKYDTFALLRLRADHDPLYIIVKSMHFPSTDNVEPERVKQQTAFLFEEHHCAINYLTDTVLVFEGDDGDPHGLFEYITSVIATKEMEQALEECGNIDTSQPEEILTKIWESYKYE